MLLIPQLSFFCQIFSFGKFPFGLEPKLFVSSYRTVVFFPDFPALFRIFSSLGRAMEQARCLSSSTSALDRFPIVDQRAKFWYLLAFSKRLATTCF
jgi:hypothetical protein